MKNIALYCTLVLALAACSNTKPIDIATTPVQENIMQPAAPRPVQLSDVKFKVVTKNNLDAFIADQTKIQGNDNPVFIAISISDYQTMSLNLAELKRYIDQQKQIILYYKSATAPKN